MKPYYERGGVALYHADCRDVLPELGREACDLIVTDPPYGVGYQSNTRQVGFGPITGDACAAWVPAALSAAGLVLRRNRHAYVFGKFSLEDFPLRHKADLVWDKDIMGSGDLTSAWGPAHEPIMFVYRAADRAKANLAGGATPARLRHGSVLRYRRPNATGVNRHPTEKPVPLLRRLIESSSFPGELVLDPFAGSGSTAVAALVEGRRCVGVETDEKYLVTAVERCEAALDWLDAVPKL